ncbi:MAG: hypothetical protein L0Y64_17890 [Myxococcaceae bacterium]|nr:hypothetical protein [Myxococcaceae bacterium]
MRAGGMLLAVLVCGVASGQPRVSRRSVSHSGLYRVQLVEEAEGRCRLEVESDSGLRWALPRCVGMVDDAFFVSRDGERVWVVHTLPRKVPGKAKREWVGRRAVKVPAWVDVVVVEKFDRRGTRLDARRLSALMSTAGYEKVRELSHHFHWLAGVGGVPGKAPHLDAAGRVELVTVEGKTVVLPLE